MTEMNDHQLRQAFFDLFAIKSNQNAVRKWAQNRVRYLEQQIEALEAHLRKRNATIDELEYEIKTYQTAVSQKTGSTPQESDEDRHQRRRRERMLDEVTLICVRSEIASVSSSATDERRCGRMSRDSAENICDGIDKFDAKQ